MLRPLIHRRHFLTGILAGSFAYSTGWRDAMAVSQEEIRAFAAKVREEALKKFPFECVTASGDTVLRKWQELKGAGRGTPIIVGDGHGIDGLARQLREFNNDKRDTAEFLTAAAQLSFPKSMMEFREREKVRIAEHMRNNQPPPVSTQDSSGQTRWMTPDEAREFFLQSLDTPPDEGEWPAIAKPIPALTVTDVHPGWEPMQNVDIVLIPTDDWTAVPAYLRWGCWHGFFNCPPPEYHIAAFRSWRDRFGIELVGMNLTTMNIRVARPPRTREEAVALAREQYSYCSDMVDDGGGTINALAASLLDSPSWNFSWAY